MSQTFTMLGRGNQPEGIRLPLVDAADTPLAGSDDFAFGSLTPTLAALLPESESRQEQIRKELNAAGYYQPHAAQNLAAVRYLGIILPLVLLGMALVVVPPRLERVVLGALLVLPAVCWALPRLVVKGKGVERLGRIEHGIPDMLDMLSMCVSQGMTVPAALRRVSAELAEPHPALHTELKIVTEQAEIGSLRQALENFSRRIELADVHSFTSLLIQTEKMGTGVSAALSDYSDNIREGLKQRADEKGNRAAFKLLFPTVLCLMPAVYMFLMGPSIVEFTNFRNRDDRTLQRANEIIRQTGPQQFQRDAAAP